MCEMFVLCKLYSNAPSLLFRAHRSTVPLMLGCFPVGTGNLMHTYVEHGHQRAEAAAATARPGCQELAGALACIFTMARICTE